MDGQQLHKGVFVIADNILSPIGSTTAENMRHLKSGESGVQQYIDTNILPDTFSASLFSQSHTFLEQEGDYTKFEQLLIASITDSVKELPEIVSSERTILIISSTKGNISLLETETHNTGLYQRIALHTSAGLVAQHFGFVHTPIIVSNACISGVVAIITGMRLLQSRDYDHAIVVGADVISKFVLSGFGSFQALSDELCKPFDKDRKGINLGEGAATVVLSTVANNRDNLKILGGAISNDANHISGPSRTGEELAWAINEALAEADLTYSDISFISAHGTATMYNDEMEANAINIAGMQTIPVNSLKGYYGHTLGAAGLIETVVSLHSLKEGIILPTPGFQNSGVSKPLNVSAEMFKGPLENGLKTASGFGGCNAALVFGK
ncbi:MAG: beta-ketoacyl synthase N-terminal-like domain-containing protein [Flavipsychrobacter sp.]|nr:beta-ketoacyl synthase N-terminal-like domain-containing protein [Flavipsychrobacter sp.]